MNNIADIYALLMYSEQLFAITPREKVKETVQNFSKWKTPATVADIRS